MVVFLRCGSAECLMGLDCMFAEGDQKEGVTLVSLCFRIQSKTLPFVFKALNAFSPTYLSNWLYEPAQTLR